MQNLYSCQLLLLLQIYVKYAKLYFMINPCVTPDTNQHMGPMQPLVSLLLSTKFVSLKSFNLRLFEQSEFL